MNRFAVFGNPISHSLSPMIHNEFAKELGIELSYEKILSSVDEFVLTAEKFIEDGGLGFNITLPFKVDAFNFSEERTSNAKAAGAVNTIKIQNKVVIGENTDGNGNFGLARIINSAAPIARSITAADIDGDEDLDIVGSNSGPYVKLSWYENLDGMGNFSPPEVVDTSNFAMYAPSCPVIPVISAFFIITIDFCVIIKV